VIIEDQEGDLIVEMGLVWGLDKMNIKHLFSDKIHRLAESMENNFPTRSFKPYYFPYAKSYFRMNVLKLSPLLNFVRGI